MNLWIWKKWQHLVKILGKRYDLSNVDTFKYLIDKGANIHVNDGYVLPKNAKKGHLDVVKYLIGNGANVHAGYDFALRWSTYTNNEVYEYLKSI